MQKQYKCTLFLQYLIINVLHFLLTYLNLELFLMENVILMSDRLRLFIDHTGLKDYEFGQKIGANKQFISDWTHGKKIPLTKIGDMLRVFPELNARWFLTGIGEMLNYKNGEIPVSKNKLTLTREKHTDKEFEELQSENKELLKKLVELQQEKINWLQSEKKPS